MSKVYIVSLIMALFVASGVTTVVYFFPNNNLSKRMGEQISDPGWLARPPAVAGQFYPGNPTELAVTVERLLAQAASSSVLARPRLLVAPHAGYPYSGPVAAAAFKTLAGYSFDRVIILGVSHNFPFSGVAASGEDRWQTPLGEIAVDKDFISQLEKAEANVFIDSDVHAPEHSLEVEVPFLQAVLGANFKIVPLLLGGNDLNDINALASALNDLLDNKTLLVISSDLSHYPPYEVAQQVDNKLLQAMAAGGLDNFLNTYQDLEQGGHQGAQTYACGRAAISVGLKLAELRDWQGKILQYANSGDTEIGDKSQVVGYGAVAFFANGRDLNEQEQRLALQLARNALQGYYFDKGQSADLPSYPIFQDERGVFVTLRRQQSHELRGCIGHVLPTASLEQNIKDMTIAAAVDDARFPKVTADELDQINIEISVLSPLERVDSVDEIELGKHGVMVKQGLKTGIFLPQVAQETGWDLPTFLSHLCADKAGIDPEAWRKGEAELYKFRAQVFAEQ